MTGPQALQSVRFITAESKRFAVLSAEAWEALVQWLETLEDAQVVQQALAELKAADGERRRAGWLEWSEAEDEETVEGSVQDEDFDEEIARTRQNVELMALLEERARQTQTFPLDEVRRQLELIDEAQ